MIRYYLGLILFLSLVSCKETKQELTSLPRSTPEAEGVYSKAILDFLEAIDTSKHELHSLMILRHGKVVAEGWWNPYHPDLKHTMYSVSKSWTSTAAGFAVGEGLLSVEDKVISFFPDQLPDSVSPYLAQLRVKDLLSMSAGQEPDPTWLVTRDSNWVKSFLAVPIQNEPGTVFLYNTLATYMVSAILQKITGQKVIEYLRPRLFDPLHIEGADWEVDPFGVNVGGWGLRVKTEDMAKLGQLYLQKGLWNGTQILPSSWIEEATTATIKDNAPYLPEDRKPLSDWAQGYGYQFWRCRNNAYRADGAFGQYIIVMPDKDAVIAITSETPDMQGILNLVWQIVLPAVNDAPLPVDDRTATELKSRLDNLTLPIPKHQASSAEGEIDGKTFSFDPNERGYESISFRFQDSRCQIELKMKGQVFPFDFGAGQWHFAETSRPGPYLVPAIAKYVGLPLLQVAGSYTWTDDGLELTLRYIESPHTERMLFSFDNDKVVMEVNHSQHFGRLPFRVDGRLSSK